MIKINVVCEDCGNNQDLEADGCIMILFHKIPDSKNYSVSATEHHVSQSQAINGLSQLLVRNIFYGGVSLIPDFVQNPDANLKDFEEFMKKNNIDLNIDLQE